MEGVDLVEQSVREIIYTRAGEGIRAFNIRRGVLYGTRLHRYLFESVDHVRDLVSYEVKRALDVWEPRILVRRVDVSAPADLSTANGRKTVLIDVQYVLRATNRADNLVVPYAMRTAA